MSVVLVTGCSSGVGLATAQRLAAGSHRVFGTVRRPEDAPALESAAPGVRAVIMEITDPGSIAAATRLISELAGTPDVLINNVGVPCLGSMEELAASDLQYALDVNVLGPLRVFQAVVPGMRTRRSGQIITVSSSLGAAALPVYGGYCATKFALEALSESMHHELRRFGVMVNVVRPGLVATPFAEKKAVQRAERVPAESPYADLLDSPSPPDLLRRISKPEDVARVIEAVVANPGLRFRWVCGEDSAAWVAARKDLDDEAFFRLVEQKGYGFRWPA